MNSHPSPLLMFLGTMATSVSMVVMGSRGEAEDQEEVGGATIEGATANENTMLTRQIAKVPDEKM